jgi:Family of unknown function (DUF6644)
MNSIYPFFKWVDGTWLSKAINDSKWLFPAIEGVHIVALALLFGAVIVLNLRLLGIGIRNRPVSELAEELAPWTFCSLIIILISGVFLFVTEATKSYRSMPFRIKIALLVTAIVFHYTVSRRIVSREGGGHPGLAKVAAVFAIALWVSGGLAGRAIGFF